MLVTKAMEVQVLWWTTLQVEASSCFSWCLSLSRLCHWSSSFCGDNDDHKPRKRFSGGGGGEGGCWEPGYWIQYQFELCICSSRFYISACIIIPWHLHTIIIITNNGLRGSYGPGMKPFCISEFTLQKFFTLFFCFCFIFRCWWN